MDGQEAYMVQLLKFYQWVINKLNIYNNKSYKNKDLLWQQVQQRK